MNKVFRVKWNAALKRFDVTSELTRGQSKSSSGDHKSAGTTLRRNGLFSLSALMLALGAPVQAADIDLDIIDSKDGGHVQRITGSDNLNASSWGNIASGDAGVTWLTYGQAMSLGKLKGDGLAFINEGYLGTGSQIGYQYVDPRTGNVATFQGYDNSQMRMMNIANQSIPLPHATGVDGQYVDRNLIQVDAGGTLAVNVGDKTQSDWYNDPNNRLLAYLKGNAKTNVTSSVFKVESANSGTPATLNYNSKTVVNLGNFSNQAKAPDAALFDFFPGFAGAFNSAIGAQNVQSLDDLKAYNNALIAAVQRGEITPEQYQEEFKKAQNLSDRKYIYIDEVIAEDDAVRQVIDYSRVAYLLGVGTAATINIASDAAIQGMSTDISLVRLTNGATLNNYGSLGLFANTSAEGSAVITARDNAVINNYGVIDAGTRAEMAGYKIDPATGAPIGYTFSGHNSGIVASNTTVNNQGVINVAPNGNYLSNVGVNLSGTSVMQNAGSLNASAAPRVTGPTYAGKFTVGVQLNDTSKLTNTGTMYLGRDAQENTSSVVADNNSAGPGSRLVFALTRGEFVNAVGGIMTLGSLTQGGYAAFAKGATALLRNEGTLNINGKAPGSNGQAPLQNVGFMATGGANQVLNAASGNIILDGINAVAMMATSAAADSVKSAVRNDGTITIKEGIDPATKTANYGLWAEGDGSTATNAGTIEMTGDGAIGAHARNGGIIAVTNSGELNFNGNNQTGYYVYGAGSKVVDSSTATQDVSTEGSTLYRVDGGASFDGNGSTAAITASGKNATALLVTSNGAAASQLATGDMTIDVTGEDATGIRVNGSAQGELSAGTQLTLSGAGSTAGIVDGSYTDITGGGDANYRGNAKLTSHATLDSSNATATNAIGYIARNGGTLDHQGNINFTAAGTTGVLVDGGTLDNSGAIHVNGVAVNIQGADSVVVNSGTVEATDGEAAFNVGNGAHLALSGSGTVKAGGSAHGVLLNSGATGLTVKDATIDMAAGGTGNGIENAAEIAGIQLDNTTINVGDGTGVRTAATLADTNSGTINVNGSGTGIYFGHANGSATNGVLDTANSSGLVINVNDAAGKGIVTNTSGDVKSGVSVNVNDAAGGAALIIGGSTSKVEQSGKLTSKSLASAVVDVDNGNLASFINSGDILANSATQSAIKVTQGSNISFTNASGGNIRGQVDLSNGNNSVTLEGGSTANDVITGSGNDNYYLNGIHESDVGLFTSLQAGAGSDTLNFNASRWTVTDPATLTGFEKVSLTNGSTLTLDDTLLALGDAQDDGAGTGYNLSSNSTLVLKQSAATQFNSKLEGSGTVAASTGGNAFDFTGNNASNSFSGTLALTDATFSLDGNNTQALTRAMLQAGAGSTVTVADGTQNVGGLRFAGGTVAFNTGTPGETEAKGTVQTANLLDVSGSGTVEINPGSVNNNHVLPPQTVSLLEQDEGDLGIKLAGSDGTVTGAGGNLELRDSSGNLISDALTSNVLQDGNIVAKATYDYRLTSGQNSDGLYVSYGLTELDLLTSGADALSLNAAGKTGNAADLSARITGSGDLAISSSGLVSLSNSNNDYSGKTDVRSGGLLMNNDNVLGNTAELAMAAGTGVDMNGHSQTVGLLNSEAGAELALNGGALTIARGGNVNGSLRGSGALNLQNGTLTVNGSNTQLSATTTIANGATAALNSTSGLGIGGIVNQGVLSLKTAAGNLYNSLSGSGEVQVAQQSDVVLQGDNSGFNGSFSVESGSALTATRQQSLGDAAVTNSGSLNLASNDSWTMANSITGSGVLNQNGSGVVTLSQAAAQYSGDTNVNGGGLQLGSAGNDVTLASGQVNVAQGGVFGGFGGTAGSVVNQGTVRLGELAAANGAAPATFRIGGDLSNSGEVTVGRSGGVAGNQLLVAGNYTGNNGHLTFNTALGDDNSVTDKLVVEGDTAGSTRVSVNNAGGLGAATLNGIELISVKGASDGEFVQDGRIVAGAYDYFLVRGGDKNANWYLFNFDPGYVIDPGEGDGSNAGGNENVVKIYRPESGAYASNMAAANTLFNTRLHDRLGETHYVDALTGEQKVTSMWLRNVGGHTRSTDSSGQLATQANRYVMQMGGDVAQWSSDGANRYHLGVMAGYGNQQSNTRNKLTGHKAEGSINGYSTGVYATWLQDNSEKSGAYVDSWLQYNWFDNSVKGDTLSAESYKSKGFTASLETGYTWKLGEKNERESYYLQPQAQVTWMGVEADQLKEANGTRVSGTGKGNVQTRLGGRVFIKGHSALDNGKERLFQPFVEANWIHNSQAFGSQLNGVTVNQAGTRNIGELKAGVEGQVTRNVNLWGNVGQQMGDKGYSDTSAMLGVKINF